MNQCGDPGGIRTRVPAPPHAFASESRTCGVLSQRPSGGDGNSYGDSAGRIDKYGLIESMTTRAGPAGKVLSWKPARPAV
jgi:hypothetical protein